MSLLPVLARIEQDVAERPSDLARRAQHDRVIPAIENRPRPPECAIDRPQQPSRHALRLTSGPDQVKCPDAFFPFQVAQANKR